MWPYMSNFGWGAWLFGGLMMLLFWGGLILMVVLAMRAFTKSNSYIQNQAVITHSNAVEIAENRYASGEISKEEFETIRQDLES